MPKSNYTCIWKIKLVRIYV